MGSRQKQKRPPVGKKKKTDTGARNQQLCELEWQHTVSAAQLQRLETVHQLLEDTRSSFTALYDQGPVGYVTLDLRGYVQDLNATASRLLGFERDRLQRVLFNLVVHRNDVREFVIHLARCKSSNEQKVVTELRLQTRSGRTVPVQLVSVPFVMGEDRMFLTALVDLTERRQSEQALGQAKEFAESIVETVREPLAVLDADLRIVSVNRAFSQFFNRPAQFAKGHVFEVLLNLWWTGNELRSELEKVLLENRPLEDFKIVAEVPGCGRHVLLLSARRLYQKQTSPPLILIALENITEQELAREELRKINEELEQRVAARTEALRKSYEQMEAFCYSIAHDLRAPLRSMTGFSHLLADQFGAQIGEEGRGYALRIQQSADRMDKLIRDLLQYGRLNTIELSVQEVDLEHVFGDVLAQLDREIEERHAQVRKVDVLPCVSGNRVVLQVALANLVANALKFVPPDTVPEVTIWSENRRTCTRLWVRDNGIGIAPENHDKIFGVFQRLHHSERYPGTGIGLALVSKGVERIGGRVGVESELGKGSRFWIELQKAAPAPVAAETPPAAAASLNVLPRPLVRPEPRPAPAPQ